MGDSLHIANQRDVWRVVCSEPDYCKVGSKTVPFDSFATIGNKVRASRNVIAQQQPIYRMGDVHQGVQANAGKGIPSGTSLDQGCVRFISGQDNVKANGVPVVCHDSACLINCNAAGAGGARGTVVTEQIGVAGKAAPVSATGQKPNAELQSLLDKAADKRSLWEKTQDGASGLWDSAKRIGQAGLDSPGQAAIGALKGLGNIPTDLVNLAVLGSKYVGPLGPSVQSQVMNQAALQAYQGGNTALANQLASNASAVMSSGYVGDLLPISNAAQQAGALSTLAVPGTAMVKGASAVAKVAKGSKALDVAADATKIPKMEVAASTAAGHRGVYAKGLLASQSVRSLLTKKKGPKWVEQALAEKRADPKLDALLTDDQYLSIRGYTSNLYNEINPALRSGAPGEYASLIDNASSGMDTLRQNGFQYEGIVRRDVFFSQGQIDTLFRNSDGVFKDPAFLSSTTDLNGVLPGNTTLYLNSNSGVSVGSLSEITSEAEILFKPGTAFEVIQIKPPTNATSNTVIYLQQITP